MLSIQGYTSAPPAPHPLQALSRSPLTNAAESVVRPAVTQRKLNMAAVAKCMVGSTFVRSSIAALRLCGSSEKTCTM